MFFFAKIGKCKIDLFWKEPFVMLNTGVVEWLIHQTRVGPWVSGYVSQLDAIQYMRCGITFLPARRDKYVNFSLVKQLIKGGGHASSFLCLK